MWVTGRRCIKEQHKKGERKHVYHFTHLYDHLSDLVVFAALVTVGEQAQHDPEQSDLEVISRGQSQISGGSATLCRCLSATGKRASSCLTCPLFLHMLSLFLACA